MANKTYKIRKFQNGKDKNNKPFINYSLTIPSHIAEKLPESATYACEVTNEGILFRPATQSEEQVTIPEWAKSFGGPTMAEAKTKSQLRSESVAA